MFRGAAQLLKSQLASLVTETDRERRLKEAITAYGDSAALANLLREHARINPGQHITVPSEAPEKPESQR